MMRSLARFRYQQLRSLNTGTNNETFRFEINKIATLADASAIARIGSNAALAVCSIVGNEGANNKDFAGLTVNYRTKSSAFGRIPSSYTLRDIQSASDILTSRAIDRSLRPMIPKHFGQSIQVHCSLLAMDVLESDPTVLLINAASAALHSCARFPCGEPVAAVRICGESSGQLEVGRRTAADLDVLVTANASGRIVMLEVKADFVEESRVLEAIEMGRVEAQRICEQIGRFRSGIAVMERDKPDFNEELAAAFEKRVFCQDGPTDKKAINEAIRSVCESMDNVQRFDEELRQAIGHWISFGAEGETF